jgi:hypothetical protein
MMPGRDHVVRPIAIDGGLPGNARGGRARADFARARKADAVVER